MHDLCQSLFTAINADLTARGLLLREGTLVDSFTLIAAPSSTKNQEKKRDPEMHQTKKGNQWYFGMKAHIGADRASKLVHTVVVTAANVADLTKTAELLHGAERCKFTPTRATPAWKSVPEIVALGAEAGLADCVQGRHHQSAGRRCGERGGQGRRKSQSVRAGVCGASLSHREEYFPASQSAVSGAGEERASTLHLVRAGQRGHRRAAGQGVKKRVARPARWRKMPSHRCRLTPCNR